MNKKTVLVAVEMVGTLRALDNPLSRLTTDQYGWDVHFAAAGAAAKELERRGTKFIAQGENATEVLQQLAVRGVHPQLVIMGAAAGVKPGDPTWTGLELSYGIAALNLGIPLVVIRDWRGLAEWTSKLGFHPHAGRLLTFLLYDEGTLSVLKDRKLSYQKARAVGSAAYDDFAKRDWERDRETGRHSLNEGLGAARLSENDFLVMVQSGAKRDKVLEVLEPLVAGLLRGNSERIVFAPMFHPKDSDAPYASEGQSWITKDSPYNAVLDRLKGSNVRVIREPVIRSVISDPGVRIAIPNLIFMGALSTDIETALFARTPQIITGLPLSNAEGLKDGVNIELIDCVANGSVDMARTREDLEVAASELETKMGLYQTRADMARERVAAVNATRLIVDEFMIASRLVAPVGA